MITAKLTALNKYLYYVRNEKSVPAEVMKKVTKEDLSNFKDLQKYQDDLSLFDDLDKLFDDENTEEGTEDSNTE